jgi:hypothetical protein
MPPRIDSTPSADLYHEKNGVVDHGKNDLFQSDSDRFPIQVAVPIVIALNLSLWLGIGLLVRALL